MYSKIRKNKLKKLLTNINLAPFSESLVHSKYPDQTPQSAESDHGLRSLFTDDTI